MEEDVVDDICFPSLGYSWSPEVESDDFRGVRKFKNSPLVAAHPS